MSTMIEYVTDLESEMYELVCRVDDEITDDEIYTCLKLALGRVMVG